MCDYNPHTCRNEVECELAVRMKACGHIAGQECLLRSLENNPVCPMCRHVTFASDEELVTIIPAQNEFYDENTIGLAL